MAPLDIRANAVRPAQMGFVLRVVLLVVLLGCAALVWSAAAPKPVPPAPNWTELDRALLVAIRAGDHAQVQDLLERGADANARNEAGETALMQAALNADAAMVQLLLRRGAEANAHDPNGFTPLLRAVHDVNKVRLLLRQGAQVDDPAVVLAAMIPGSRTTLELLLRHGGNPRARTGEFTALMGAAFAGDRESVSCLLDHGADVHARTSRGYTAVFAAAFSGDAVILEQLLQRGADPDSAYQVDSGEVSTPVIAAASQGNTACVRLLLDRGVDVNFHGGSFERSALLSAATRGDEDVVRLLLVRGAAVNAEDWEGDTALTWALGRGQTPVVKLLRQAGGHEGPPALAPPKKRRPLHRVLDAGSIQRAVAASLPPLQRSGEQTTRRKGCITCHSHSLMAMTVGVARRHGFAVDEAVATRERAAIQDFLSQRIPSLLGGAGIDPLLGPYSLVGFAAEDQKPSRVSDALVHYLVLRQRTDGHWRAEAYRPPEDGSDFMFTALTVRGLQVYAPPGRRREIADRIARARAWLAHAQPAETVDRAFQLLGLRWAEAEAEVIGKAARSLLREQREDGGWAQLPTLASDAYATGQVLYALHEGGGVPTGDPAYRRGVQFLLRTQLADGSWFVPTRCFPVVEPFNSGFPHGKAQFISAAATCWATLALAVTVSPGESDLARGPAQYP